MKKITKKAFTLVELLIVIGIIGILAVTLLLNLNPAEAQKKSRDAKRLKDIQTIQSILEQYINDGNAIRGAWTTAVNSRTGAGTTTFRAGTAQSQTCTSNWFGINTCLYAKSVPTDPSNAQRRSCVNGATTTMTNCLMIYAIRFSGTAAAPGSDYEIVARQESISNANKVVNDGGNSNLWYEIYTSVSTLIGT